MSRIDILIIPYDFALGWMPQGLAGDWTALVQVMASSIIATLNQYWRSSISPYCDTVPQYSYTIVEECYTSALHMIPYAY